MATSNTIQMIIRYASRGFKQVEIARAVGVDESYVSQIVNDPQYASQIEMAAVQETEKNSKYDDKLDLVEDAAMDIVQRKLSLATSMKDALLVAHRINSMKRRRDTAPATRQPQATVVNLVLPQIAVNNYVMNSQSEIIEVEGRTMISAAPAQLENLAKQVLGREPKKVQEAVIPLPQDARAEVMLQQLEAAPQRKRFKSLEISDII